MSPLRVAYLDATSEIGGAERLLLTLLEGVREQGVAPLLVCPQDGPLAAEARLRRVPTIILQLPRFFSLSLVFMRRKILNPVALLWNLAGVLRSVWLVRRRLTLEQVDLIQTNSALAHIYGGLTARVLGVPCVWYFHDLVETRRFMGCTSLVWRVLAKCLADRVVGVSMAVIRSLSVGSRGCVIYSSRVSQWGATRCLAGDLRSELRLPSDAKLVGYIGRIGYVKGLDVLVDAARKIVCTDPRIHFVLFGDAQFGEIRYKRALVNKVQRLKLGDHWHWFGYDPQAVTRIPDLDLVVLPSRREALPLVLLEAAMAGKVVVASRVGGIPEIIVDGETGALVSPDNPEELATAIFKLVDDPRLANSMGNKARERVTRVFSLHRYHDSFLKLYDSLLQTPSNSLCS